MKLFFFDYDGTLYQPRSAGMTERTVRALKALQKAGHKLCLCTGRCEGHLTEDVKQFGFDSFAVGCGAALFLEGEQVFADRWDPRLVTDILRLSEELHLNGAVEGLKRVVFYTKKASLPIIKEVHSLEEYLASYADMPVYKFSFYDPPMSDAMRDFLEQNGLSIINNDNVYYEVVRKGQSKGKAVRDVAAYYGIPLEDTYGFGDSPNDRDMLQTVGTSVVVANAPDYVQQHADHVIPSVYDDGVAVWIEQFLSL